MSLKLKAKKLSRMSPHELYYRAGEKLRAREERRNYEAECAEVGAENFHFFAPSHGQAFEALCAGDLAGLLHSPGWLRKLPIPLDGARAGRFKREYRQQAAASLQRAERVLSRQFSFLGIGFETGREIPWQQDPLTGWNYPGGFYRDLEIFRDQNGIDIKHVWELNRLQFLIESAKAWYLSGDRRFQADLEFLVEDWYRKNPYKTGVAWASALEVGVRALSFFWVLNFYLAAGHPSPRTVKLLLKLLFLSGRYIRENLSIYFSPYNHLIGELAALFLIGYFFPGFRGAAHWAKQGWDMLCQQMPRQFHADGGSVEQATFYHHFTLGFYLQAINARRLNGDAVPEKILKLAEQALTFAMHLTRPDGTLPWIGDIDAARSLYFSAPAHWDFRGFQAIGAAWFDRADMKFIAGEKSEEAFWLLSDEDYARFASCASRAPAMMRVTLPISGYTVFRTGWHQQDHFSLIDCGELAAGVHHDDTPSAAHGHADLLAIELAPFGESVLIDPGFSNYRGDPEWHAALRSTLAHNTLEINGRSQAAQVGILNWAHAPRFRALQQFQGELAWGFCGEHAGYAGLPGAPVHRRYFLFIGQTFWLTFDWVFPTASSDFDPSFDFRLPLHFAEHIQIETLPAKAGVAARGKLSRLEIRQFAQTPAEIETHCGGPAPWQGWISPTYRDRRPAPLVVFFTASQLPFGWMTVYVPTLVDGSLPVLMTTQAAGLRVHILESEYDVRFEKLEPEGEAPLVRVAKSGALRHLALFGHRGPVDDPKKMPIQELECGEGS